MSIRNKKLSFEFCTQSLTLSPLHHQVLHLFGVMEDVVRQLLNENNVIINRRFDQIEQGIADLNRRFAYLERRLFVNEVRNASLVNLAFDNSPDDVIALREISPNSRGEYMLFL